MLGTNIVLILFIWFLMKYFYENKSQNNRSQKIEKIINQKIIFSGTINDKNMPTNFWNFYDENEESILNLIFYNNGRTNFNYEIKQKNSSGKIVYSADVKNGKILNEYDYEILQNINTDNGNFLYENYCLNCHNYSKEGISKSLLQMRNIELKTFIQKYKNDSHKMIPRLTENEFESICLFINKY